MPQDEKKSNKACAVWLTRINSLVIYFMRNCKGGSACNSLLLGLRNEKKKSGYRHRRKRILRVNINLFVSALWNGTEAQAKAQWMAWPFTDYGWTSGFLPIVTKILFMGVIFVSLALILRLLFGPKGPLRGKGWETMQEAREREEREKEAADAGSTAQQKETSCKRQGAGDGQN